MLSDSQALKAILDQSCYNPGPLGEADPVRVYTIDLCCTQLRVMAIRRGDGYYSVVGVSGP